VSVNLNLHAQKNYRQVFENESLGEEKRHTRSPNLIACAHKINKKSYFKINTKIRYNSIKNNKTTLGTIVQQEPKLINPLRSFPSQII